MSNTSSIGAFMEWFDENIMSIEECTDKKLDFKNCMLHWCRNNNHEWTNYGVVINHNISNEEQD